VIHQNPRKDKVPRGKALLVFHGKGLSSRMAWVGDFQNLSGKADLVPVDSLIRGI